jgi:hypothetical protein
MDPQEGQIAQTPEQASELEHRGYTKCHNQLCDWWIAPEAAQQIAEAGQTYKCPRCQMSYDLNTVVGQYPRQETSQFTPGGATIAGIQLAEQGQIGEDLVEKLGQIPGYGPITWWHQGGASSNSPLDGACQGPNGETWGIEVKAINADAKNLRFMPGNQKYRQMKNAHAEREGWVGVLGILVLLNYRTGKADLYSRAYPLGGIAQPEHGGWATNGVGAFRHTSKGVTQFLTEVPFANPLVDPKSPTPNVYGDTSQFGLQKDDIPF